ncbi:MAG: hypothetical protein U0441_36985 [Polyangiaceae bacterium]
MDTVQPQSLPVVQSVVVRGVVLGARLALERLRDRRTYGAVLLAVALAIAGGIIERSATSLGAVDRALGGTFRLVVPLLTLSLVSRAVSKDGLGPGTFSVARFGVPRFAVALGVTAAAAVVCAGLGAVTAALTVVGGHTASAPPLAMDLLQSAWIGAVTSLAYAAWTAFGSTYFRGRGRWMPIAADYMLGGSTGFAAALLPRAHASSLLGIGEAPLEMPRVASFVALFVMTGLLTLAAATRSGR